MRVRRAKGSDRRKTTGEAPLRALRKPQQGRTAFGETSVQLLVVSDRLKYKLLKIKNFDRVGLAIDGRVTTRKHDSLPPVSKLVN